MINNERNRIAVLGTPIVAFKYVCCTYPIKSLLGHTALQGRGKQYSCVIPLQLDVPTADDKAGILACNQRDIFTPQELPYAAVTLITDG